MNTDKHRGPRAFLAYAIIASTVLAAAIGFLQVAAQFTNETPNLFVGYAFIFALVCCPAGAVSGMTAGLLVLLVFQKVGLAHPLRSRQALAVGALLILGSVPGIAFAAWLSGTFALETKLPSSSLWLQLFAAVALISVGGVIVASRSTPTDSHRNPR